MKISNFVKKKAIFLDLKNTDKESVLFELLSNLIKAELIKKHHKKKILEKLLEREKLGSTAIGQNFAIPHAKIEGLERLLLCIGRHKQGVEFDSLDGEPVNIIFLLLIPTNEIGIYLKLLAKIAKILRDKNFRRLFMEAKTVRQAVEIIKTLEDET